MRNLKPGFYSGLLNQGGDIVGYKNLGAISDIIDYIWASGAIGLRLISRKRQKHFEMEDYFALITHVGLVFMLAKYPSFLPFPNTLLEEQSSDLVGAYLMVVLLCYTYAAFFEFLFVPRSDFENFEDYRGVSIFSKREESTESQERSDEKKRLLDPLLFVPICYYVSTLEEGKSLFGILLVGIVFYMIEELLYNYRLRRMKRKKKSAQVLAEVFTETKEPNSTQSDNDFTPSI